MPVTITAESCRFPPDQPPPGSYLLSCESCTVSGFLLTCSCLRIDGQLQAAQSDFSRGDTELANTNGVLTCEVCQNN